MSPNDPEETMATGQASEQETFEAFKDSFSYGSRIDLNVKFLKNLTPEEADGVGTMVELEGQYRPVGCQSE
jgi:hypothetical protein